MSTELRFLNALVSVSNGLEIPASEEEYWELFDPVEDMLSHDAWWLTPQPDLEKKYNQIAHVSSLTKEEKEKLRADLRETHEAGKVWTYGVVNGVLVHRKIAFRPLDTPSRKMMEYRQDARELFEFMINKWARNPARAYTFSDLWYKDNYIVEEYKFKSAQDAWDYGSKRVEQPKSAAKEQ